MVEVYKMLRGFEGTDEITNFQKWWDVLEGMIRNCLKNVLI